MYIFTRFHKDQSGAVTVEWVVIAAIAVALALATMSVFGDATDGRLEVINEGLLSDP